MSSRVKQITILLMALAIVPALALPISAAWPSQTQWIPAIYRNWDYISNEPVSPGYTYEDLVPDLTHPTGSSSYWYFDGTNAYFRMILNGNPLLSSPTRLRSYYWHVALDTDLDNYPEYMVTVDGSSSPDRVITQYNSGSDLTMDGNTGFVVNQSANPYTSNSDGISYTYLINGYVRVAAVPGLSQDDTQDFYLDFYVPLSSLARQNGSTTPPVTLEYSAIKLAYGSSDTQTRIATDLVGPGSGFNLNSFYSIIPAAPFDSYIHEDYGVLRDTRNPAANTNQGTWSTGEQVTFTGYSWPINTSQLYREQMGIRIISPGNVTIWEGVASISPDGTAVASWTIPEDIEPGVYELEVSEPRSTAYYSPRDRFTVAFPRLSDSTKSVSSQTAGILEDLEYTITVSNTGNLAAQSVTITDQLPEWVTYIAGSTRLNDSPLNDSGGTSVLISGYSLGTLQPGVTNVFKMKVKVSQSASAGFVLNNTAYISWIGGTLQRSAAAVVVAPSIKIKKRVSLEDALPGQVLTYTAEVVNEGTMLATSINIYDTIPPDTEYIIGSATRGGGVAVAFKHDAVSGYDASEALPITALRWTLPALGVGESVILEFQVRVK